MLDTLDEPVDGRLVSFLLADPIGDGGQWDMFKSLVKKYGVCPKEAMPETACSRNTREMDSYLTRYLRGCACRLRRAHEAGVGADDLASMRREMMGEVLPSCLATCLGEPPAGFEVRLRDKDDRLALSGTFTPQEFFAEAVGMELDDYVSLISAPTADKPFGHAYTVSRLGNVEEDGGVRYLNLPVSELKRCAMEQLADDLPVWFGCDVAQSYLQDEGIMDTAALDVDALFGFPVEGCMDRAERLEFGESLMTHAMVLEGVRLDADGAPKLWKVENSWGKDHGRNGFDTISDAWFDEYVYQVVVDKRYLTDEERHVFETEEARVLALGPHGFPRPHALAGVDKGTVPLSTLGITGARTVASGPHFCGCFLRARRTDHTADGYGAPQRLRLKRSQTRSPTIAKGARTGSSAGRRPRYALMTAIPSSERSCREKRATPAKKSAPARA